MGTGRWWEPLTQAQNLGTGPLSVPPGRNFSLCFALKGFTQKPALPPEAGTRAEASGSTQEGGQVREWPEPMCWKNRSAQVPARVCAQVTLNDPKTMGEMGKENTGILYCIVFPVVPF